MSNIDDTNPLPPSYTDMVDYLLDLKKEIDIDNKIILDNELVYVNHTSYLMHFNRETKKQYFIHPDYRKNIPGLPDIITTGATKGMPNLKGWIRSHGERLEKMAKFKGFW